MTRPIPCPPSSRTTLHPSRRASSSIAAPTSPRRAPSRTTAMPASRQARATSTRRRASALASPITNVAEVSPWKPPRAVVTSTLTMSPSARRTLREGMPWQTTWFLLVHTAAGKPLYPSWLGFAPRRAVSSRTHRSMSAVETPGPRRAATWASVAAAAWPAPEEACSLGPKSSIDMRGGWTPGGQGVNTVWVCFEARVDRVSRPSPWSSAGVITSPGELDADALLRRRRRGGERHPRRRPPARLAAAALWLQRPRMARFLGAALFERTSRGVRLLPAGEVFLARARSILGEVEAAVAAVRGAHSR